MVQTIPNLSLYENIKWIKGHLGGSVGWVSDSWFQLRSGSHSSVGLSPTLGSVRKGKEPTSDSLSPSLSTPPLLVLSQNK